MTSKVILTLLLAIAVTNGCDPEDARRRDFGRQTEELYQIYLNGGRDEARRSMVEANRLVEEVKLSDFEPHRAAVLLLGYGRLYALDYRAGSNDMAQADLIKARYWALRSSELSGDTPGESEEYVEKFTGGNRLIEFVDSWEKNANHGREPRYIQHP